MRNKLFALALLAVSSVVALAQAPVIGSTVNAINGYLVNGTAPNGDVLCGNGTTFVPAVTCGTAITQFYQTIDLNGAAQNQRFSLNFSSFFTAADSASPSQTTIDPAHVGANATCAFPATLTVDVYGRTTSCTPGTAIAVHAEIKTIGCTTGGGSFAFCDDTLAFPSGAFPNATFTAVSCNGIGPTSIQLFMTVESKSFSAGVLTVVCRTTEAGSSAGNFAEIDVIGVNN